MRCFQFYAGPVTACIKVVSDEDDVYFEDETFDGQWWITDFYSRKLRSGMAKECLENVKKAAREAGISRIGLHPYARDGIDQESLVKFYESCGFSDRDYGFICDV
jgi:GNAT superfamily N-acetyltransferase